MIEIHPSAIVDPKAELHDGVKIGAHTIVSEGAVIGAYTTIATGALITGAARIGERCRIAHGAVIGTDPQDLKFKNEPTIAQIGNDCVIREYVTVNRGTIAHGITTIGNNCMLMAYVHVAHDCIVGNNVILANCVNMAGHTEIGDFVNIGGLVPIHQFVRIGSHCFIGGGYRVPKDVPPYVLAIGDPMRYSNLNVVGLRRRGFDTKTLRLLHQLYRILYRSGLNITQGLERAKQEIPETPETKMVFDFYASTKRGVIGGGRRSSGGSHERLNDDDEFK
ncbi:MAG: acyl-ACP--UDP-N-acetylglucosamine O-acyltransferase [bacterium]|nr:acyl-ACP--UDP-N-acetylglucosamine O-acyltransferase [bacterium]